MNSLPCFVRQEGGKPELSASLPALQPLPPLSPPVWVAPSPPSAPCHIFNTSVLQVKL